MMGWEQPLMVKHAALICGDGGKDVMNVGFGLGLVDDAIQVGPVWVCLGRCLGMQARQGGWLEGVMWAPAAWTSQLP
jgi:hypothetical protein